MARGARKRGLAEGWGRWIVDLEVWVGGFVVVVDLVGASGWEEVLDVVVDLVGVGRSTASKGLGLRNVLAEAVWPDFVRGLVAEVS